MAASSWAYCSAQCQVSGHCLWRITIVSALHFHNAYVEYGPCGRPVTASDDHLEDIRVINSVISRFRYRNSQTICYTLPLLTLKVVLTWS
jgi:hypothetical protein